MRDLLPNRSMLAEPGADRAIYAMPPRVGYARLTPLLRVLLRSGGLPQISMHPKTIGKYPGT